MQTVLRFFAVAVIGSVAMLGVTAPSLAETVLRFSNWIPGTGHPSVGFQAWADSIEKESQGRIKIEFFHSAQLGNARDHYNMARDGISDFSWSVPAFEPGRFPIFSVMSIPYMTSDAVKASNAFHEWYLDYADTEMSEVKLCAITMAPEGTLNFKDKEIRTPDQMEGVKMRPVGTYITQFMKNLGAVPIAIPATEARQAFDRGMVDGIAFPWRTLYPFGLDKVTTHHQDMIFYAVAATIVMNKDKYNAMSDEDKAVIDQHCNAQWSEQINQIWFDWEKEGRAQLTNDGHTIYKLTPEEEQQWIEASLPLREDWKQLVADKIDDPAAAMDALFKKLAEKGAAY